MELHWVLTNEWTEEETSAAAGRRLEELVPGLRRASEALRVARVCVDERVLKVVFGCSDWAVKCRL